MYAYDVVLFRCHRFGLKTTFIDEGTFKARVLADDEEFPVPDKIDFSSVPIPVSCRNRVVALVAAVVVAC